jgi:hypothetical protein
VPTTAGSFEARSIPNPNRPHVQPGSLAFAGVVVCLRGIDPARAKPWDLPPVRVELNEFQVVVKQGDDAPRRAGFVRRGDAVAMASAERQFHVLRGRGAAFFSLPFPEPGKPLSRTFDHAGRVDLSSGAGYYWASAELFVDDHPYYALTDADGRFAFDRVPAGETSVVAWHPSWHAGTIERNPETGLATRLTYAAPIEAASGVRVQPGQTATAELRLR